MWLFVEGQMDPANVADAAGNGRVAREFWYNLDTGAVVYCTRDPDAFKQHEQDRIRVWTLPSADVVDPIDITTALTGHEWPYTSRNMGSTTLQAVKEALVAELNRILIA